MPAFWGHRLLGAKVAVSSADLCRDEVAVWHHPIVALCPLLKVHQKHWCFRQCCKDCKGVKW